MVRCDGRLNASYLNYSLGRRELAESVSPLCTAMDLRFGSHETADTRRLLLRSIKLTNPSWCKRAAAITQVRGLAFGFGVVPIAIAQDARRKHYRLCHVSCGL